MLVFALLAGCADSPDRGLGGQIGDEGDQRCKWTDELSSDERATESDFDRDWVSSRLDQAWNVELTSGGVSDSGRLIISVLDAKFQDSEHCGVGWLVTIRVILDHTEWAFSSEYETLLVAMRDRGDEPITLDTVLSEEDWPSPVPVAQASDRLWLFLSVHPTGAEGRLELWPDEKPMNSVLAEWETNL